MDLRIYIAGKIEAHAALAFNVISLPPDQISSGKSNENGLLLKIFCLERSKSAFQGVTYRVEKCVGTTNPGMVRNRRGPQVALYPGWVRNVAHKAVVSGLGIALAFGMPASAIALDGTIGDNGNASEASQTSAAMDAGYGYVVVHAAKGNEGVRYQARQIFKADVIDSDTSDVSEISADDAAANLTGKIETNIQWASEDVQKAIEKVITGNGGTDADIATAQDAAAWIQKNVPSDSAADVEAGNGTRVASDSIANQIAAALIANDVNTEHEPVEIGDGEQAKLGSGMWLLTTDSERIQKNQTVKSPILAIVGGGTVAITGKASVPSLTKEVQENSTGEWGLSGDFNIGETIPYRLTGTLPDNYGTFDTYYYEFSDHLSDGLTADSGSIKVTASNGKEALDVTEDFDIEYGSDNTIHVACQDLKKIDAVTKDTKFMVEYTAKLNGKAVIGSKGNPNTVELIYSSNPSHDGHGETTPHENIVYTYKLSLVKLDASNSSTHLAGAKFTLQAADGSYVQADGSKGTNPYEFTTDSDGNIAISGLDAGVYRLSETEAPAGYEKIGKDVSVTITSAKDQTSLTSLTASISGNQQANISTTTIDTGEVAMQVTDMPSTTPPDTERIPNLGAGVGAWIAIASGAALVGIGGYQLHQRKKNSADRADGEGNKK